MSKHQCPVGYVQVTDTRTIQKLILKLMVQFHKICEKYHLVYNLCDGSLLGAVRHKGFIPWDDDMDVCMPRDDYEKFIKIAKTEYANQFDTIVAGDDGCIYPFAKICMKDTVVYEAGIREKYSLGLWLDIFPVDGYPGDSMEQKKSIKPKLTWMSRKLNFAAGSILHPVTSQDKYKLFFLIIKSFFNFCFRPLNIEKLVREYDNIATKYKVENCDEVISWCDEGEKNIILKNIFFDRVLYDFEEYKFLSVRDYDSWLTRIYGDYMTPPPPEKRVSAHGYELFVKKDILTNF